MSNSSLEEVKNKLQLAVDTSIDKGYSFKIVFSKPKQKTYKKCVITPYIYKETYKLKVVKSTTTQDFTENIDILNIGNFITDLLSNEFYFLDFKGQEETVLVKQSKKESISVIHKKSILPPKEIKNHNRDKQYLIPSTSPFLQMLGITNKEGIVLAHSQKKFRQINKFIEIVDKLISESEVKDIVDMGCGKGYLTFSLYAFLSEKYPNKSISVTGYDIRPELMALCNTIAVSCGYHGLKFIEGHIGEIALEKTDMLVALHACDIATDMAIFQGLKSSANFMVLSPCCHKQIRNSITIKTTITSHGIYLERQAEMITDTIRALLLESQGYQSSIFEFIGSEHTAKNTMITAKKAKVNPNALSLVENLKREYGIEEHYLEKLIQKL